MVTRGEGTDGEVFCSYGSSLGCDDDSNRKTLVCLQGLELYELGTDWRMSLKERGRCLWSRAWFICTRYIV